MKRRILFVCTGNVCRSPMAAALFLERAARAGEQDLYYVSSAGTWALEGQPASEPARLTMQHRGLDLSGHRGRMVSREMLEEADLILVMTTHHKHSLGAEFAFARGRIHLLSELVDQHYDISDPYGRSLEEYESCAQEMSRLIDLGYPKVAEWLGTANPASSPTQTLGNERTNSET